MGFKNKICMFTCNKAKIIEVKQFLNFYQGIVILLGRIGTPVGKGDQVFARMSCFQLK